MSARLVRLCLALGVISAVTLVAPAVTSTSANQTSAAPPLSCGSTILYKPDRSRWVCSFDDEFNGTSLDTSKWTAWNNVDYFSFPNQCYYSDSQHVSVRNGSLNLSVTPLAAPKQCPTPTGSVTANYGAGLVHTSGKFNQAYGRYEARIKFGGTDNIHDDFWLYPTNSIYPGQAEIDVAEPFGGWKDTMFSATHVTGADGTDTGGVGQCTITNWSGAFHTYAVVWTSTGITFYYDGTQCYTFTSWTPLAGYTYPAPFNQPFFVILQTVLDGGVTDSATTFPATTQVDYVRVWK